VAGETQKTLDGFARRPLPSFDQWLAEKGNGHRGDGFEAFNDLAKRSHEKAAPELDQFTGDEQSFLRMWLGLMIAVVELSNIEHQQGRTPAQIIKIMPRVCAAAAVYATASVVDDNAPMRKIAKIIIEEFRFAAKEAADQIEAQR
jgi:hypothetical protein